MLEIRCRHRRDNYNRLIAEAQDYLRAAATTPNNTPFPAIEENDEEPDSSKPLFHYVVNNQINTAIATGIYRNPVNTDEIILEGYTKDKTTISITTDHLLLYDLVLLGDYLETRNQFNSMVATRRQLDAQTAKQEIKWITDFFKEDEFLILVSVYLYHNELAILEFSAGEKDEDERIFVVPTITIQPAHSSLKLAEESLFSVYYEHLTERCSRL